MRQIKCSCGRTVAWSYGDDPKCPGCKTHIYFKPETMKEVDEKGREVKKENKNGYSGTDTQSC